MRPSRATAATILLFALAAAGCGIEAGGAARSSDGRPPGTAAATSTTEARFERVAPPASTAAGPSEATDLECPGPGVPLPSARAAWLVEICPAVTEPARISADELMFAVGQPAWDWPAVEAACERMGSAADDLVAALGSPPEGSQEAADDLATFGEDVTAFARACLAAEPAQDKAAVQAAFHGLDDIPDTMVRFEFALADALQDE